MAKSKLAVKLDLAIAEKAKAEKENRRLQAIIESYENGTSIHQFRAAVERAHQAEARVKELEAKP